MTQTALLVIDVQQSFKQRPYWDEAIFAGYAERQSRLIERGADEPLFNKHVYNALTES